MLGQKTDFRGRVNQMTWMDCIADRYITDRYDRYFNTLLNLQQEETNAETSWTPESKLSVKMYCHSHNLYVSFGAGNVFSQILKLIFYTSCAVSIY